MPKEADKKRGGVIRSDIPKQIIMFIAAKIGDASDRQELHTISAVITRLLDRLGDPS